MLNLLIVDDEIYAVEGLKTGVAWSSLGFTGVYEAYNVKDAQEIIRQVPIDIVICDIEMPEGNGFELLEWIRGHDPDIASLFLTCHADFQYAQRAIQLGTQDYLLKPVNFSELKEVVQRLIAMVSEDRDLKAAQEVAQAFWEIKNRCCSNVSGRMCWVPVCRHRQISCARRCRNLWFRSIRTGWKCCPF